MTASSSLSTNAALIRKLSIMALCINATLSLLKIFGGIIGSSQAVAADGVHSLSDCVTDIILIVGVKYWSKPPDDNHPYGHKRIETIISIIVGLSLSAAAIGLGYNAIATFHLPPESPPTLLALGVAVLSIVVKETLYRYTIRTATHIRSTALKANAWHQRSDALSSIPVALAVIAVWLFPQYHFVDNIGAVVVSGFILHAAWQIIRPNLGQLADASASPETVDAIKHTAMQVDGVEEVHAIRTRVVGADIIVDLHVQVDETLSIGEGHNIGGAVKAMLKSSNDAIDDVLVHIEPYDAEHTTNRQKYS
ncbi:MAG: cation transporter [Deltaproteobacteria bacterium]|nr:cation transporter [Deltaproteobacteria bacterium]MBN2673781.1 cation transporter [Deltaproteobacteria bacterium]